MTARNCTQLLEAVQHNVLELPNYLRLACTSEPPFWRPDGLNYLITDSYPAGESRLPKYSFCRDSSDPDRALAHMLLEKLAWMIETIAPRSGQDKS